LYKIQKRSVGPRDRKSQVDTYQYVQACSGRIGYEASDIGRTVLLFDYARGKLHHNNKVRLANDVYLIISIPRY